MVIEMDVNGEIRRIVIASVILGVGVLVYLTERSGESVYFLPDWWMSVNPSSSLGQRLPSFAHTFAFAILTAVVLAPWRGALIASCGFWAVVNSLFELGQIDAIAAMIAFYTPEWLANWPILENLDSYFLAGTFDPLDIGFVLLGAVAAYSTGVSISRSGASRC